MEGNKVVNGRGRPTGTETDRERRKGRQSGARRTTDIRSEKTSVGGERVGVPGVLQVKGCRLDSALTKSGTGATWDWSWYCRGWPRPTWTWISSSILSALTASTPAHRLGTALLLQTRRADTAAEWQFSTGRHHILRWRRCDSLVPTSLASSWRRGRGGGTSLDATSPRKTHRRQRGS